MKRRQFLAHTALATIPISFNHWIGMFNLTSFEMKLLRRNTGIFKEKGGTIGWLIQPDGIVVIDTQWKEQSEHLIAEINARQPGPVDLLINTHHHGDHTSGNIAFKDLAKQILAHENSKANQMAVAQRNGNMEDQLFPDITYTDQWVQKIGDETIHVHYWGPAHTNGDSIIHFLEADVVHCGDLIFNRRYPYIDKSTGASIENWINILGQMQAYFSAETIFIFGHARDGYELYGNKSDLAAFADYLSALLDFVGMEIKNGKSKDEILLTQAIPGAPEWSGEGIERSLNAAITELGLE